MTQNELKELSLDEEKALIEAAQRDTAAFAPLYRQYVQSIYRYLYSRLGQVNDAEDMTAQVFLEAFQGLNRYRNNGTFAAWLFTIARRRVINHFHRSHQFDQLKEQTANPDTSDDPLVQALRVEEYRQLRDQLLLLKDSDLELLRLRFAARLGFKEIASILRRSEASVKMKLYRLLRHLESRLEVDHE
jgi:RNA polymerase sigma-70 factor (ECF subfamily)